MYEGYDGLKQIRIEGAVPVVVDRLIAFLKSKRVTVFAVIDHSREAEKVGIEMPDTKLVVFGDPKSGTALMIAAPNVAIDLPLKILVAEESPGTVVITYNTPDYLMRRHDISAMLIRRISSIETIVNTVAFPGVSTLK